MTSEIRLTEDEAKVLELWREAVSFGFSTLTLECHDKTLISWENSKKGRKQKTK